MKEYKVRVHIDRTEWLNKDGYLHREDGAAVEYTNGNKEWWLNGLLHREDGAAIEWADGSKSWWLNGQRHRVDGPAIEWPDGSKEWFLKGKRHRIDGFAVEWADGSKEWWLNDENLTEEEFLKRTPFVQEMTMEEVCKALGKTIKIVK